MIDSLTYRVKVLLDIVLGVYAETAFRRSAVWMNALVSLERFLTIAFPLGTASHVFKRAPSAIIISVFLACCLSHMYFCFEYTVAYVGNGMYRQDMSPVRVANPELFETVKSAVRIVSFYIPLFGSLLINILLMAALHKHADEKKGMTTSRGGVADKTGSSNTGEDPKDSRNKDKSTEAKASKFILALTLTFFFMALPGTINATVATYSSEYGVLKKEFYLYTVLLYTFNLVMYLSQTAMFLVSVINSRRFRRDFVEIVTTCFKERDSGERFVNMTSASLSSLVTSEATTVKVAD